MASKTNPKRRIHWRAPTTILVALIAGVLFAVGHHLFYLSLDGKAVDDARYDQQMNIRFGTAFSYLVRAALAVTVATVYWQIFWRTLLRNQLSVSTIDSLADILGGLLSFLDTAALRTSPFLFALAGVHWLIPFAAIVPPGTLTVFPQQTMSTEVYNLTGINFEAGPLATITFITQDGGQLSSNVSDSARAGYGGASQPLTRLALAAAVQGELPNFPAPVTNSSYRIEFDGPRVQCKPISNDILSGFDAAVDCDFLHGSDCQYTYSYLAWAPASAAMVPFSENSLIREGGPLPTSPEIGFRNYTYLGSYEAGDGPQPATLYIAVDPTINKRQWVVLECSLWNSTYTVDFDFSSNAQQASIVQTRDNDAVPVNWLNETAYNSTTASIYGPELSYQAVMECLGKLLIGAIYEDSNGPSGILYEQGSVLQSEIAYTTELFPVYNVTVSDTQSNELTFQEAAMSPNYNRPMADVVEEIFQNMTLALFSRQSFLNGAVLPTNMTVRSADNIYVYSAKYLVISYCLAIGFSAIAAIFGLVTVWYTQASYSNKFSTTMRTTCELDICALVPEVDRTGADPLPKHLASQKIKVGVDVAPTGHVEADLAMRRHRSTVSEENSLMLRETPATMTDPAPQIPWEHR